MLSSNRKGTKPFKTHKSSHYLSNLQYQKNIDSAHKSIIYDGKTHHVTEEENYAVL